MDKTASLTIKMFDNRPNIDIEFPHPVTDQKIKDPEHLFLPSDEGGQSIGVPVSYRLLKDAGGLLSFSQEGNYMIFTISLPLSVERDLGSEKAFDLE